MKHGLAFAAIAIALVALASDGRAQSPTGSAQPSSAAAQADAPSATTPSVSSTAPQAALPPLPLAAIKSYQENPDAWNAFLTEWQSRSSAPRLGAAAPALQPPTGGGPWTPLTNLPKPNPPQEGSVSLSNPLLLTDGTVIAHAFCSPTWYRLTPDNTGSYVNGTWSQIAPMPSGYAPLYFASEVLPDGLVLVEGGEYNGSVSDPTCQTQTPERTTKGAIYNPVANAWTAVNPPAFNPPNDWTQIGDAASVILNNGTFMLADCCDAVPQAAALFNEGALSWTATGADKSDTNNEEGWTLLPNGEVLTVDANVSTGGVGSCENNSEIYNPATGNWSLGPNTSSNPGIHLGDCSLPHPSFEMGPALLRPDGTVVAFGANTNTMNADPTAIFNSTTIAWSAGPSILTVNDANNPACPPASVTPGGSCPYTLADAPAALLPDGNILFAASPANWTPSTSFPTPTHFFEMSPAASSNGITQVADTPDAPNLSSFEMNFLVLPTGQVLAVETDKPGVQVYNPTGSPNASWAPVITSVPPTLQIGTSYTVSGTQLNGLSQGAAYGDDVQASTNYPLVRITNNATGHVFYAKTSSFSTMSVAPGTVGTANFTLAAGSEAGPSSLVVVANGIASLATPVTVVGFALSVTASGNGTVTSSPSGINCPGTCSANFNTGQQVTLTAAPSPGSFFAGWRDGGCSGMGTCMVTVNAAVAVTATFNAGFVLTASEVGNGVSTTSGGTPASISCGTTCSAGFPSGTVVTVSETPGPGWTFNSWVGVGVDDLCVAGACQVTMNSTESLSAVFVATNSVAQNTWSLTCNGVNGNLNGALAGTAAWTFPSGLLGTPSPGDIILLNGICLGDVTVTTSDLIFTNHNDTSPSGSSLPSSAAGFVDGIQGQLEFGASAVQSTARNLLLEGPSSFSGSEVANLYVHDGGVATVQNSWIGPGPLDGVVVQSAPSTITLLNSTVSGNGTANAAGAANGARVIEGASLVLGASDGSLGAAVNVNGFGILLLGNAGAELNGSTVSGNGLGQIDATGSSSLRLAGTQVTQASGSTPAIQVIGRSAASLVTLANGTGDTINSNAGTVLAAGGSEVVLHGATVQSSSAQQPTIESSADSAVILAGGNSIGNSASGGTAIEVDHSSALMHEPGSQFGFANAAESITGSGSILVQSSIDLGQGDISSNPSVTWTIPSGGNFLIQQNSSFRLSGGVTVTGGNVRIQQGSNGFFNCNNSTGGLCTNGANNVGIVCVSSANNPGAHATGNITGGSSPRTDSSVSPSINVYDLTDVITGGAHAGLANACLNF